MGSPSLEIPSAGNVRSIEAESRNRPMGRRQIFEKEIEVIVKEIPIVRKRDMKGIPKSKILGATVFCVMVNDRSVRIEDNVIGTISQPEAEVCFFPEAVSHKAGIEAAKT
jgi:hypothetical protein